MKSIIIKKLQFSNYSKEDLLVQIGQNAFSSEQGEGVRVIEENPDYVACHYLVESSYQQDTYNYETGDFEKVNYTRVDKIPFFIDFDQHSLGQHRRTRKRKGPAGRFHPAGHIYAIPSALQPH